MAVRKTVFLARHAQSIENLKTHSVKNGIRERDVGKVAFGLTFVADKSWVNCELSELGERQVENVSEQLRADRFFEEENIEVVLCSTLVRALETCKGLCDAMEEENPLRRQEVVQIEELKEKTPFEWIPGVGTLFYHQRIQKFEEILAARPEETLFIVGHSQYFRTMLRTKHKMRNVDVYKVDFTYVEDNGAIWENPERLYGTTNS